MGGVEIEIPFPASVGHPRPCESCSRVEDISVVHGSFPVCGCRGFIPGSKGGPVDHPVVVGIFKGDGRTGPVHVERDIPLLLVDSRTVKIVAVGTAYDGLQGKLPVYRDSLVNCVSDDRYPVISYHAPVLVAHVGPYGEYVMHALGIMPEQGFRESEAPLPPDQVEKRVQCPVGVPQREYRVVFVPVFHLVDIEVEAPVAPVDVHVDGRIDFRVIEGCVQHCPGPFVSFGLDDGQLPSPFFCGFLPDIVEPVRGCLSPEIGQGSGGTCCGKGNFHNERLRVIAEIEMHHNVASSDLRKVPGHVEFPPESGVGKRIAVLGSIAFQRLREGYCKVCIIYPGPATCDAESGHERVVLNSYIGPSGLAFIVVYAVAEIHDERLAVAFLERVFVDSGTRGGCHLGQHVPVLQEHFVVSRRSFLGVVGECGTVIPSRKSVPESLFPGDRHHENVSEVGVPCPAEVRMREPDDGGIRILISCTIAVGIPVVFPVLHERFNGRVRAELDHSVRGASSGKYVTHAARADERIDIFENILLPGLQLEEGKNQE